MEFRIDVFAWIPQPDVPNPLHGLVAPPLNIPQPPIPGGIPGFGFPLPSFPVNPLSHPGGCGPRFGGDNFQKPPSSFGAWKNTFRAKQSFAFKIDAFGDQPLITHNPGVIPGTTTVLTDTRQNGGRVCHSLTATVKSSDAKVVWRSFFEEYRVQMKGEVQDPVPAATASDLMGGIIGSVASALTPNLEWSLDLIFCAEGTASDPWFSGMDVSAATFGPIKPAGSGGHVFKGAATVRRYPSYVVYVTIGDGVVTVTNPVYFADANDRSLAGIVISSTDAVRQIDF